MISALMGASAVSMMSAQQLAKGDSVMIKRECTKYLTGEQPSVWVYDKVHTVGQIGTKRFPEGILLFPINSWICAECLAPTQPKEAVIEKPAPVVVEEPVKEEKPIEEAKPVEETKPIEEEKPIVTEEPAVVEPVIVEPIVEEPVSIEPEQTPAVIEEPVTEPAPVLVEQIKGDSIKSQQNFRHGYDRFTIGLRGGASSLLHNLERGKWTCGGDIMLDLQYAHYWTKDGRPVDLGLITGIGIGYAQSSVKTNVDTAYTANTSDGNIDYTIKANEIKEHDGQLQLEIPLFFSLIHESGLFFNIGPKFMLPLYTPYKQQVAKDTHIEAYFQDTEVKVTDEAITGMLAQDDYTQKGSDYKNQFTINIMLSAEIGYEWILKSGNSLGLGVYADYSVYNSFKNSANTQSLINVIAPEGNDLAIVNVAPATKTYAKGLGFFDVGVKLAYHFNFPKKRQYKDARLF